MLRKAEAALHGALGFAQSFLNQNVAEGSNFRRGLRQRSNPEHVTQHDAHIFSTFKARKEQGIVLFEGTRAEPSQAFGKFFVREAAVELLLAKEGVKQVWGLHQCVAQVTAMAEDGDSVMRKKRMGFDRPESLWRGFGYQALEEK